MSLVLFTRKQLRAKEPMLNLKVFKSKTFTYSTLVVMIVFTGFVSAELILPMYLQMARGFSALDSGLTLMPGAIIMGVMSPITGKIYDKIGARGLSLLGISLLTIGSFMLSRLTATTPVHEITAIYSLRLFGLSMFMMPITTDGLNSLDNSLIPHGTAINNTLRQVAGSIGSAILVTIMTTVSSNSGIKNPILSEIHGMNESFLVASIFCFIALIIAFFVIKKRPKNELKGNS
nr:MFS transporter [Clostridium sp. LY3-2]